MAEEELARLTENAGVPGLSFDSGSLGLCRATLPRRPLHGQFLALFVTVEKIEIDELLARESRLRRQRFEIVQHLRTQVGRWASPCVLVSCAGGAASCWGFSRIVPCSSLTASRFNARIPKRRREFIVAPPEKRDFSLRGPDIIAGAMMRENASAHCARNDRSGVGRGVRGITLLRRRRREISSLTKRERWGRVLSAQADTFAERT